MTDPTPASLAARLRHVRANMQEVLESLSSDAPPTRDVTRVRIERWGMALDSIIAAADPPVAQAPTMKDLLAAAIEGADIAADATAISLRDLTQLAAALRPGRVLTVANAELLNPMAQAGIATAATGRVTFLR